jgi:hypothetical protein
MVGKANAAYFLLYRRSSSGRPGLWSVTVDRRESGVPQ